MRIKNAPKILNYAVKSENIQQKFKNKNDKIVLFIKTTKNLKLLNKTKFQV